MRRMHNEIISSKGLKRRNFLKISGGLVFGSMFLPFSSIAKDFSRLKEIKRSAFTMGSIVTFTAYHVDERLCITAIDEAIKEMKLIDTLMSVYNPNSQLSSINNQWSHASGNSHNNGIAVDVRIIEILNHAKQFSELTNGAFDITVEPLMKLYGFRDDGSLHPFPSDKIMTQTLDAVGMDKVVFNNRDRIVRVEHPLTRLDFGGIAVGYAIDQCVSIFKKHGIESALINHSGDIYAIGTPPGAEYWEIGIVDPLHPEHIITSVNIKNQALSTSGNYENFIEKEGKRIGHILNPKLGKPSSTILSGTTIAPTAIEADAFSTGMFVMGLERSQKLIKTLGNVECIGIINNGNGERIHHFRS